MAWRENIPARVCGTVLAASAIFATPAIAGESASGGFRISLNVPVVCDLDAQPFELDASGQHFVGQVQEFCNSNRGFQVFASHRMLEQDESISVDYGGSRSTLDLTGMSPVAFRSGARFGYVPVSIEATNLRAPIALEFGLTAI